MSLLSKLFGGGAKPEPTGEDHEGFTIYAEPMSETGGHRICARIEKEIDGALKSHTMIRADLCQSRDEAVKISTLKAKALIDQQGDRLFG